MDGLLLALRIVRVNHGGLRITGGLTAAEALAAVHRDLRLGHERRRHETDETARNMARTRKRNMMLLLTARTQAGKKSNSN